MHHYRARFISLVLSVLMIASTWKIFTKAGEPGWAAIVPFYNLWVLMKVNGLGVVWFILLFVPVIQVVALIYAPFALAKSFGKGAGFGIGLLLLGYIFFPLLAFGGSTYVGPGGKSA